MTEVLNYTQVEDIPLIISKCRNGFMDGKVRTIEERKQLLRTFVKMIDENEEVLCAALKSDLRKHYNEAVVMELSVLRTEAYHFLNNIHDYAAPKKPSSEGVFCLEDLEIRSEPLGVILIIGPWNYPILLVLQPLLGALAAGNTAVIKPSELAPVSAALLQHLLPKYFSTDVVGVVNGAVKETTELLTHRFDHIVYTGGSRVAQLVMTAAAKHLTPVTLELGGKSPVIVDTLNEKELKLAARRIMWGKVVNAGQTCVAPDYILVRRAMESKLIEALREAREEMMGSEPLQRRLNDYASLVNVTHFHRVKELLKGGSIVVGGEIDEASLTIAPTILTDVDLNHSLMKEEIFGPLLPLVPFDTPKDAFSFVKQREKPLALYIFSNDKQFTSTIMENTSSGGVLVNDVILHVVAPGLPFGGVGQSGIGAYHGKYSFQTFSHQKSIMRRPLAMEFTNAPRYPPYTASKLRLFRTAIEAKGEKSVLGRRLWFLCAIPRFIEVVCAFVRFRMAPSPALNDDTKTMRGKKI